MYIIFVFINSNSSLCIAIYNFARSVENIDIDLLARRRVKLFQRLPFSILQINAVNLDKISQKILRVG